MLRLDDGQECALAPRVRARIAERLEKLAATHDCVLVSDYGAGVLGEESIAAVCGLARKMPVLVDSRHQLHAFRGVTVCKPNEPELGSATGLPIATSAQVENAAQALRRALGCEAVLATRGCEGMLLALQGRSEILAPHGPREAVDVTGAGDAVIAAFSTALAVGGTFLAAAQMANIAGGLVVQKPGTCATTLDELRCAVR
jgi:D-glycero-beta-D-manno-heptose-7-phosphate kinase